MDRGVRRKRTQRKVMKRKALIQMLGLQAGSVYEKHRKKVCISPGYMATGNVSHYVAVRPSRKTRRRNRYGHVYNPSVRDGRQLQSMQESVRNEEISCNIDESE